MSVDAESKKASGNEKPKGRDFLWISPLYFAEGVPNAIVTKVFPLMAKCLEIPNDMITAWGSFLSLPWILKPLWAPVLDAFGSKRLWILLCQAALAGGLAMASLAVPLPDPLNMLIACFLFLGFCSATHDAAADGFYIIALDSHRQALYSGLRNSFYRLAVLAIQGGLVVLAGNLEKHIGMKSAWLVCLALCSVAFLLLAVYHCIFLPRPPGDATQKTELSKAMSIFSGSFISFFKKESVLPTLLFILLFRFAESQLLSLASVFMLDKPESGGLGLSLKSSGYLYGTIGVISLLAGGIIGGVVVARHGLKRWLWPMALAINIPNVVYVILAWMQPESMSFVGACIAIEQFGYGFGVTALMLYMVMFAAGSKYLKTSHFALMTGIMYLGLSLPGSWAGKLQMAIGYKYFFLWVMVCTIPSFIVTALIKVDPDFGKSAPPATR